MKRVLAVASVLALASHASLALANNVGENHAWQFETSADKVNKAAIADLIEKNENEFYSPPVYNTYVDRQYNCTIASTSTGNQGNNTNLANSPTTSGPTSDATANDNETDIDGGESVSEANSDQDNTGDVDATVDGDVNASIAGSPDQALNSEQSNTGNQTSTIDGSTACNFANVLN